MPAAATNLTPRFTTIEPILAVLDVSDATIYYRDVLCFDEIWTWEDPPTHGGARRDDIAVQFSLNPTLAAGAEGREIWIRVRNLASLYSAHQERKAQIVSPLELKPWRLSEYTVRDLNGYHLRFAGGESSQSAGNELPAEVHIESRIPSWPEMKALNHAVGWDKNTDFETASHVPETAIFGAVAIF